MRWTGYVVVGVLVLAMTGGDAPAAQAGAEDRADRKAADTTLFNALRDVINKGADMYNNGDHAGCYRLFQGALLTAGPLLEGRPELQKGVTRALAAAEADAVTYRRAYTLRAALDRVRKELNPAPKKDDKLPLPKVEDKKNEDKKPSEKGKELEDPKVKNPETKKDDPDPDDPGEKLPLPKKEDKIPDPA